MKSVRWRKSFEKDVGKLGLRQHEALIRAIRLFRENVWADKLRRHKLHGKYKGLESIDVTPDLRALFLETDEKYIFYYLKNHNQLYS